MAKVEIPATPADPAPPRILALGETALSIDFGNHIDPDTSRRVMALDRAVTALAFPGIIETVPTYRALTVHLDPLAVDRAALLALLSDLASGIRPEAGAVRRWRVPVVFGGEFGIDLEEVADHAGLSPTAFIEAYCAGVYSVYMIGFLPGFSYLGGLAPSLAMPRREQPRLKIPASSVSIGGQQAAIGSVEGPSGWHLIGRTPVRPFMRGRETVFLFQPGDEIIFEPIGAGGWQALDDAAAAGHPVATEIGS